MTLNELNSAHSYWMALGNKQAAYHIAVEMQRRLNETIHVCPKHRTAGMEKSQSIGREITGAAPVWKAGPRVVVHGDGKRCDFCPPADWYGGKIESYSKGDSELRESFEQLYTMIKMCTGLCMYCLQPEGKQEKGVLLLAERLAKSVSTIRRQRKRIKALETIERGFKQGGREWSLTDLREAIGKQLDKLYLRQQNEDQTLTAIMDLLFSPNGK